MLFLPYVLMLVVCSLLIDWFVLFACCYFCFVFVVVWFCRVLFMVLVVFVGMIVSCCLSYVCFVFLLRVVFVAFVFGACSDCCILCLLF